MFGSKRPDPREVFTTRGEAWTKKFISRPRLEESLVGALRGHKDILLSGESGGGKSWLYKYVFADNKVEFLVANMALVPSEGGLEEALCELLVRENVVRRTGYEEEKNPKYAPQGVGVEFGHKKIY